MATNGNPGAVLDDALVPPQNLDAEESVLGAMMLSPGAIASVSEILTSDGREFYRESHAKIYRAALGLYAKGEPVDAITLADELDERSELENVGGKFRIHELASVAPATGGSKAISIISWLAQGQPVESWPTGSRPTRKTEC